MNKSFFELYTGGNETNGNSTDSGTYRVFNAEFRFIVAYLSQFFFDLKYKGFSGVRIDLNANGDELNTELPIPNVYPVVRIVFPYNVEDDYLTKSTEGRKIEIIKILKQAMDYMPGSIEIDGKQVE
ncbi:MAG: hypothetical protein EOP49_22895, partial [Sphingobacteriales bacterium]